jgi:hypothetical protein
MAKPKKKSISEAPESSGAVRSIRFTDAQFEAISRKAKSLDIEFATFVRQAALAAAGVGRDEITRAKHLARSLASVGRA